MRARRVEDPVRRRWRTWPPCEMGGSNVRYYVARDWQTHALLYGVRLAAVARTG
jgi:hypothetical protein